MNNFYSYWFTLIVASVGIFILFIASLLIDIKRKEKITITKISFSGLLLSITIILNFSSGFIPIFSFIQFKLGYISLFLAGIIVGPFLSQIIALADDNINFLFHNNGSYHPGFAFGTCLIVFVGSFVGIKIRDKERKTILAWISFNFFLIYTIVSFVINPILLVSIGWVPKLSWAIYVPRLIKWIPESIFYISIIFIIYISIGKTWHEKLQTITRNW